MTGPEVVADGGRKLLQAASAFADQLEPPLTLHQKVLLHFLNLEIKAKRSGKMKQFVHPAQMKILRRKLTAQRKILLLQMPQVDEQSHEKLFTKFPGQGGLDMFGNKRADIAAEARDFLDDP